MVGRVGESCTPWETIQREVKAVSKYREPRLDRGGSREHGMGSLNPAVDTFGDRKGAFVQHRGQNRDVRRPQIVCG